MRIGVLAFQGDFAKHQAMLTSLSAFPVEVRNEADLRSCQGLIIPGGESTTIVRQIDAANLRLALLEFAAHHPIFGTCAGLIVMSKIAYPFSLEPLGLLDIEVERNAFGSQVDSFSTTISVSLENQCPSAIPAFFIRAPRIRKWKDSVNVLSLLDEKEPILVQQGHHLGATFHPELTNNCTIHAFFLSLVAQCSAVA